mmetsp:Transcript_114549/g.160869  ORF Transcript_114549/g.160869 Transcript_114549/m.160869 type:complete len:82 (+) Transcript_114549:70-315(+)
MRFCTCCAGIFKTATQNLAGKPSQRIIAAHADMKPPTKAPTPTKVTSNQSGMALMVSTTHVSCPAVMHAAIDKVELMRTPT